MLTLVCALAAALLSSTAAAPQIVVTATARSIRPGELVVLTVTTPQPASAVRAHAFDRDWAAFAVDARTWRVLVGIDLDVAPGTYAASLEADSGSDIARTSYALVVTPRVFRTRSLTVAEAFVNPPADVTVRIQREAELLESVWRSSAPERLWTGAFLPPVPDPANSAFGTRSIFNGQPRRPHGGADFQSPAGRPIKAPNAGRVVLSQELYFTGNTVIIDHGLGLFSLFAHLSLIAVRDGDRVTLGQSVGQVGATGRVTGPHLHWSVRAGDARVDPLSLLQVLGAGRGPVGKLGGSRQGRE